MNSTMKRFGALALTGALFATVLTGCGTKDQTPAQQSASQSVTENFEMETLTMDVFGDYDLTLVNCFATWCPPCIKEIPELEQLKTAMADRNVNVIGVVLDSVVPQDPNDLSNVKLDQKAINQAGAIAQKAGATYDFYIPDLNLFDQRMAYVQAVPETFFVDREGNVVGKTYAGARNLEGWTQVVEDQLADMGLA